MTSERRFASTHSAFWNAVTPMAERFVRRLNPRPLRFAYEVDTASDPGNRSLIAEVGFEVFSNHIEDGIVKSIPPSDEHIEISIARARVRLYGQTGDPSSQSSLTATDVHEAMEIGRNLWSYFFTNQLPSIELRPRFKGCGIISACEGDISSAVTLFEVKAVSRGLGVADIRQVITYLALQFAAGVPVFKSIAFINPRRGVSFEIDVAEMSNEVSGTEVYELLDDVVKYISDLSSALSGRQ